MNADDTIIMEKQMNKNIIIIGEYLKNKKNEQKAEIGQLKK